MNINDLPKGDSPKAISFTHFPTKHQAVIWRNWELVPVSALADVLGASEADILDAANDLGLSVPPAVEPAWRERGYVTIIRANWHLLPYEQLVRILGWTADRLAMHLKEDDFLFLKLGSLKPSCDAVRYRKLTPAEEKATARIRSIVHDHFAGLTRTEKPFGFLSSYSAAPAVHRDVPVQRAFDPQFLYSYSAVYGDPLLDPNIDPFPDGLLARYAEMGVTGVWLQVVLYMLCPDPAAPHLSHGWEQRLKNLSAIVDRAKRYGIGIYLYLNEPRGMTEDFFRYHPEWKGVFQASSGNYSLCTSQNGVLEHLRDAARHVFTAVPGLAGAFTITMSENLTHCHSKGSGKECPRCSQRPVHAVVAEVNRAIEEGIHAAAPNADVIAWTWAWDPSWARDVVDLLPKRISLMCVSEWGKGFTIGGVVNTVIDYSLSQPGPSDESRALWSYASMRELKTIAKVQINNSWECSAIPYIPVPYLVKEHLDNVKQAGVGGLMLSWTLGGFPGGNLELLRATPEELAVEQFGDSAEQITSVWRTFSDAFREFPFHVSVLYRGPHNMGPANLLFRTPTGYQSSMVGFPYDDLTGWRANYPEDVFEEQFRKVSEAWKKGLDALLAAENGIDEQHRTNFAVLKHAAVGVYCHFRSAYLQTRFVRLRADADASAQITKILNEEIDLTTMLAAVMAEDSTIGFEASNHYAYTINDLYEKAVNCVLLLDDYDQEHA